VLGAIVAFLIKTGKRARLRDIWWGAEWESPRVRFSAVLLSTILKHVPASQERSRGVTMLVAVVVLVLGQLLLLSK